MRYRDANRFDAAVLAAVTLVVSGAILGNTALFVAGAVPVVYLAVGALADPPSAASLSVERAFDPEVPAPGQPTTVTVTVRNEGDRVLPDVRVVDRVPSRLPVVAGSPRGCLSIRPGESATVSYEVVAGQGDYDFEAPLVRLRPLVAASEVTGHPAVGGDATLRCRRSVGEPPQVRGALRRVGTQTADRPGDGLEFHSVRQYRHGDDVSRVDWRRLAKTGDLSTVNFRASHATKTVVVVDGRPPGRLARDHGHPTGVELSAYAADRTVDRLLATGDRVGLTALGIPEAAVDATLPSDRADRPWVPVGDDDATRIRVDAVLDAVVAAGREGPVDPRSATVTAPGTETKPSANADADSDADADADSNADPNANASAATADGGRPGGVALRERLPEGVDVVLATPALDDDPIDLVADLSAAGHHVLVVSPDVTGETTPGARVAAAERRLRIERLRETGATVVDWDATRPLSPALEGST